MINYLHINENSKKILALVGGFIIHLVIGTIYITGNISIYMASYLQHEGYSTSLKDLSIILPMQVCGSTSTLIVGTYLIERFNNPWLTVILGNSIVIFSVFITSFLKNFASIVLIYGILYGTGVGLTVIFKQYTTPLMISWSHFPEHKGRITGIILAAFGLSASIFNLISTHMINPENKKPEDKYDGVKYFDADVAYRYPPTMRWLSLIYLIITLPGLALLVRPQKTQETNEKANLKQGLKSKNFWIMFTIGFLSVIPGFFLANTYKILGEKMIDDDNFLAIVGSVSSFANGSFRFFWGQLLDKIGFKKTYFLLLTLQSSLIVTLFYVAKVKALYLIWVSLILACEGGHFSVFPATLAKMFGKKLGSKLVGIIYYGFSAGAIMGYVLNITVLEDFGYQVLFWIMGVMGVASFVGSRFLSDENDYEENEKSFIGDGGLIN